MEVFSSDWHTVGMSSAESTAQIAEIKVKVLKEGISTYPLHRIMSHFILVFSRDIHII